MKRRMISTNITDPTPRHSHGGAFCVRYESLRRPKNNNGSGHILITFTHR